MVGYTEAFSSLVDDQSHKSRSSQHLTSFFDVWPNNDQRISSFFCGLLVRAILEIPACYGNIFLTGTLPRVVNQAATFSAVVPPAMMSLFSSILASRLLF
jgi:hypothetical protein